MQLMTKQMTKNIPVRMLLINHSCGVGSTGKICVQIADEYTNKGTEVKIAYGRNSYVPAQYKKYAVRIGTSLDVKLHALKTRLFDGHGYGSKKATKQFLKWADRYNPDLLWLHCIHGYYINFELLFKWIKQRPDMYVKWTQHDCWAFTGHCAHFTIAKCEKWKTACKECPERKSYPASFLLDKSDDNFFRKRQAFTGIKNMEIITPSIWLAKLVKDSYLKEYQVTVSHNTIDKKIFKSRESNFKEKYNIGDKIIILAVASVWNEKKGIQDILDISRMLNNSYCIVIVGLKEKQIKQIVRKIKMKISYADDNVCIYKSILGTLKKDELEREKIKISSRVVEPGARNLYVAITGEKWTKESLHDTLSVSQLICIKEIKSQEKLAEIYSMADCFINPTYEDNYPTVNLEAQACGTSVITYNTGGCAETIRANYNEYERYD